MQVFDRGVERTRATGPRHFPVERLLELAVLELITQRLVFKGDRRTVHAGVLDRKSTRLNSSHGYISYAVFCLKKKKRISTHHGETRGSLTRPPPRPASFDNR